MRALHAFTGTAVLLVALTSCGRSDNQAPAAGQPGGTEVTQPATGSPSGSTIVEPTGPANPGTGGPGGLPAPPVTVGPAGPVVPDGVVQLPPEQVDAKALPEEYTERNVWAFDGGRSLQMFGVARDSCAGAEAKIAEQTGDSVKVALRSMAAPQGGSPDQMCAQVLTPKPVTVRLDAPIGTRKVILTEGGY